jgi:hypothetical protein
MLPGTYNPTALTDHAVLRQLSQLITSQKKRGAPSKMWTGRKKGKKLHKYIPFLQAPFAPQHTHTIHQDTKSPKCHAM